MANPEIPNKPEIKNGSITAHERTRLLLDTTPIACRLMKRLSNGRYEVFECNEESVKLFKFKDKQEFLERYFEIFPELQPNGEDSIVAGQRLFDKTFAEGRCVSDFVFKTADGEPIPTEVTLVRLEYEDDYIIAGYTRDLREHIRMMETIEDRNKLLNIGNLAVQTLLSTEEDMDIAKTLVESLEIVGRAIDGDRVQIWRNEMIDGALHFVYTYEWQSETGKQKVPVPIGMKLPYAVIPEWEEFFSGGGYINGPLTEMSEKEQRLFEIYDIKTIVIIPLFIKTVFWGFFSIVDCKNERVFTADEISILSAISRMLVSAVNRNAQVIEIRESHDRVRVLLDKMPFACHLWNKNFEMIDCNEENARLFEVADKNELMSRFPSFAPEFQPNGRRSAETALGFVQKAFTDGKCVCEEFIHLTSGGTPVPVETTLVRIPYEDDYAVAAYLRDLREQKQMLNDIKKRDSMLDTMNRVAGVLLATADEENFEESIVEGMELIGRYLDADSVQIWSNETIDDKLHYTLKYGWISEVGKKFLPIDIGMSIPYSASWQELFMRGECINGPTASMSQENRDLLDGLGIVSTITIPLFYKEKFWGMFCVDDCIMERFYSESEIGILHSTALMLVNAINRSIQAAQIREAHGRTQLLLDTTPLAVHLWDRNYKLFDCNEESVRLFGTKDKQDYLDRFIDLSPEFQPDGANSADNALLAIKKAFEEGKHVFEWMHQTTGGVPIPSEITLVRVAYEDDFAIAGYVRDLREQKEMMNEIQQKTRLLDSINKAANILLQSGIDEFESNLQLCMGMIGSAVNADRVCIWKNSIKEGKLHCTLIDEWITHELLRTNIEISTDVPYEGNIPTFERILTKGECINSSTRDMSPIEQVRMNMHGVKSIFVAPVFVDSEFWGFVGCDNCRDETVFSEEVATTLRSGSLLIANALMRNEMTLNLKLAAIELEAALMETRKANDAKSDFLANMSHEMRTPLNAIIGLTWLSLENEELDPETQSNLEKTHNAGTTLLGIVNDILDISKIESGRFEIVPAEYNVASLINDTVTQNLLRIGEKPIELKLDIDKDLFACLCGDELRLRQIMNNLLSNGIKYTAMGEVALTVFCDREGDAVWLNIKIRDTGQGIKPEDMGKLFTDYAQLDTKANREIEGTGLGLPITKMLCEMMDGSISVESEYGKGSTFTARLKQGFVSDSTIGPEVVSSLNSFRYSDGRRAKEMKLKRISLPYAHVLIVDDNQTNLDVARGLMKPYGMKIECVDSGLKAVDAISADEGKFDAVFMDQMMPGLDGIEATKRIRELQTDYAKNIPIIALTANAVVGSEEMFLSNGFQAFLSKPIDIARLDAVIRQWIRNQEKERLYAAVEASEESRKETASLLLGKEVEGLNIENGIKRFGGDEEVYINILSSYAANTQGLLDQMEAVTADKIKNYEITVHSVKGSSYGICADVVGKLAKDLEYAAKTGDYSFIGKRNQPFIEDARKLISDIEELLASLDSENPKPIKDKPDSEVVSRLIAACEAYDMDEVDAAMEEIAAYKYEFDNGFVNWLQGNVDTMNFEEIAEKLTGLL